MIEGGAVQVSCHGNGSMELGLSEAPMKTEMHPFVKTGQTIALRLLPLLCVRDTWKTGMVNVSPAVDSHLSQGSSPVSSKPGKNLSTPLCG